MPKRALTVEVDEEVLERTVAEAKRTGRSEGEVVEDALRRHFEKKGPSVVEGVWARDEADSLSEENALALAYEELKAMREQRRQGQKATS